MTKIYADSFAAVAQFAWKHCRATLPSGDHRILVFDFEKTNKAKREMFMDDLQLWSLKGYADNPKGKAKWTHTTRVPFAVVSQDPDPFVVDDKDIVGAFGPLAGVLMLDLETDAVHFVDVSEGYVKEGAVATQIAPSTDALRIRAAD